MTEFRHGLMIGKFYPPRIGHHEAIRAAAFRIRRLDAEAAGLDGVIDQTDRQPDAADDLGRRGQTQPDGQAEQKAEARDEQIDDDPRLSVATAKIVLADRGQIDAHEC